MAKKFTARQLHANFILIHDFHYDDAPIKAWVRKDLSYNGGYHEKMDFLMEVLQKIGNKTGYELVIGSADSHWNNMGENPFEEDFGGYEDVLNIYEAIVAFIKWWHKAGSYARTCDQCKKGMNEGYCINNGESYYCSDKCLHKNMTKKRYLELYDNGEGDSYWTEWDPSERNQ